MTRLLFDEPKIAESYNLRQMVSGKTVAICAGLGGVIVNGVVLPLAIEQHPTWFKDNPWALPLFSLLAVLLFVPLIIQGSHPIFRLIYSRVGSNHPKMAWVIDLFGGALVGALAAGTGYYLFLKHGEDLAGTAPIAEPVPSPITLTTRFNPMMVFPFSIPPKTTAYVVLAYPRMAEFWGAGEIRNDGADHLVWPRKAELKWQPPAGIGDFAFTLDLTNHSDHKLVNVTLVFDFAFDVGSTRQEFIASKVKARHHVVIPALGINETATVYVANQSSQYNVFVSFPSEATTLVAGESERRSIKLVKAGVNVIEILPEFVLHRPRVRWTRIPD